MDRSNTFHGADQDNNASQDHNINMHLYPNIYAAQCQLAFRQQMYEHQQAHHHQQRYGHNDPADPVVPHPQWSVCGVEKSYQSPMKYVVRTRTDHIAESITRKIDMMLSVYTGAEQVPPEPHVPERIHASYQCVRDHPTVQYMYMADAEKPEAFACYTGFSEEELSKEPFRSMSKIGIPLSPPMSVHGWLRFVGVDLVLTDCKHPSKREAEATGFYTTVSELEGDCAGARLLRLLTDNAAFTKLDIINLNITKRFCAEDKSKSLDLYRSAGFSVRAKHVDIKVRWDEVPFDAYEMDFYPELKRIICPQLRKSYISPLGTWQMGYST
ncbi:hypothetical protein yc1106_05608 [Curvularia clavata]|uniref:Uncharacterized protein n=1 Tax=Curvularia clavata TaxID=95742 RepID=A0A9Q8ZBC0_CURCL|nr:hypothetical protein yc1106_05608 [Curvularia clavata]